MASLQQEASGTLGVHYSASHSGSKARDVNARLEEEFATYFHKISTVSTLNMNNVYPLVVLSISRGQLP